MVSAADLLPFLQAAKCFDEFPTCRIPFISIRFCDLGTWFGEVEKDVVSITLRHEKQFQAPAS